MYSNLFHVHNLSRKLTELSFPSSNKFFHFIRDPQVQKIPGLKHVDCPRKLRAMTAVENPRSFCSSRTLNAGYSGPKDSRLGFLNINNYFLNLSLCFV